MTRPAPLVLVLALASCGPRPTPAPVPVVPPKPVPAPVPLPQDVSGALFSALNAERARAGLTPFASEPRLQAAAESHAAAMAETGVMGHEGAGDGTFHGRLIQVGYPFPGAENVAEGYPTVGSVVAGWMASPGHRANILGPYRDFGGAVAKGKDGQLYWCSVFGSQAP